MSLFSGTFRRDPVETGGLDPPAPVRSRVWIGRVVRNAEQDIGPLGCHGFLAKKAGRGAKNHCEGEEGLFGHGLLLQLCDL